MFTGGGTAGVTVVMVGAGGDLITVAPSRPARLPEASGARGSGQHPLLRLWLPGLPARVLPTRILPARLLPPCVLQTGLLSPGLLAACLLPSGLLQASVLLPASVLPACVLVMTRTIGLTPLPLDRKPLPSSSWGDALSWTECP